MIIFFDCPSHETYQMRKATSLNNTIKLYHVISHLIISYHISYIISYHIISIISYHIISYHIISYHIISYIIYHISYIIYHISYIIYHISYIIYHISYIIYHIISYHIISYHIILSSTRRDKRQHARTRLLVPGSFSLYSRHFRFSTQFALIIL